MLNYRKQFVKGVVDFLFDNDEKVASRPKTPTRTNTIPYLRPNWPISAKIDTLFLTKTAEKPYHLGKHIPT